MLLLLMLLLLLLLDHPGTPFITAPIIDISRGRPLPELVMNHARDLSIALSLIDIEPNQEQHAAVRKEASRGDTRDRGIKIYLCNDGSSTESSSRWMAKVVVRRSIIPSDKANGECYCL
uniref:Putative secreted protein n=1 Tax=Anopheles darlingi TaxID=43151 RepID=A0A2M4D7P1_ANODA